MDTKKTHIDNKHCLDFETERMLSSLKVPATRSKEEAWEALGSVISEKVAPPKTKSYSTRWAVAASFAVLVSIGYIFLTHTTKIVCSKGQHVEAILPDGSNVLINSDSQLSYQKYLWWNKRTVNLRGEAFFQVKKGKTFEVVTNNIVTSVLGTSFNVFARNSEVKVYCFTGKVAVKNVDTDSQAILTPGFGVATNSTTLGNIVSIGNKEKGWTTGEFYFENSPLSNVFEEIERQFNVRISAENCKERRYSGYFNSKSLNLALELVCTPMQLEYTITSDGNVVIKPM